MTDSNEQTVPVTKRKMLKIIGGGMVFAAAGAGAFLATRDPAIVREPWQLAGQNETDPRRIALSYAILAPNPHNRQPWLVDLIGDDEIVLYCDEDRHLPVTDPFDRQITIGLGAFIETLVIAASQIGYRAHVDVFRGGDPMPVLGTTPVAHIRLIKDATVAKDPLFEQITHRRSNKDPFDNEKQLPDTAIAALAAIPGNGARISVSAENDKVARLREIGIKAMHIEYTTPRTLEESIDLMRIGKSEIIANPDGIDLGGAFFDTLALLGQANREDMKKPTSYAWKTGLDITLEPLGTGTAYGWLTTKGNTRLDQINAGRDYVRFNLKATELGIAIHPTSQALQEYPEMSELLVGIHKEMGVETPHRVQMFMRLGYAEKPLPSPRWPMTARIRNA